MTSRPPLTEVLAGLEQYARPAMLGVVRPDSCVAMTWLACEALRHFGYYGMPLNVELYIVNRRFRDLYEAGQLSLDEPLPQSALDAGAWSVGLGIESHRQRLLAEGRVGAGHVVAVVGAYLVDLSLDQASRPEHDMPLAPRAMMFSGTVEAGHLWVYEFGGAELTYRLRPDLATWHDSPDWRQGRLRYKAQAAEVIRKLRQVPAQ